MAGELRFVARRHYVYPAWRAGVQRDVDVWVYATLHDGPFSPNAAEVAHVSFFDLEKIRELAAKEKTLHPELLLALQDGTLAHACTMKV